MKLVYSRQALADVDAIATYYSASASAAIARSPRPMTNRARCLENDLPYSAVQPPSIERLAPVI
jgi:plasmid stabilization system protein ParE